MLLQLNTHSLEHAVRYTAQRAARDLVLEKQFSVLLVKVFAMALQPLDYVCIGPLRQMLRPPILVDRHRRRSRRNHVALDRLVAASSADGAVHGIDWLVAWAA